MPGVMLSECSVAICTACIFYVLRYLLSYYEFPDVAVKLENNDMHMNIMRHRYETPDLYYHNKYALLFDVTFCTTVYKMSC